MEWWDLYDENRILTGRRHIRGEELPENCYHLVVHVWIQNSKGQYLISRRAADRPTYPLWWECVGGSVVQGESSLQGAVREVKEEVGLDVAAAEGKLLFSQIRKEIDGKRYNDILDVWLFRYDGEVSLQEATTSEVAQVRWLSRGEIKELYQSGRLVGSLGYFFEKVDVSPE